MAVELHEIPRGEKPGEDITRWMGDLYAEASRRLEENPELEAEVRLLYARWDQRDPEVVALWEETRQWSLDGFNQMYQVLDIHFDRYYFNSQERTAGQAGGRGADRDAALPSTSARNGPVIVRIDELLGLQSRKSTACWWCCARTIPPCTPPKTWRWRSISSAIIDLAHSIYVVDVRQSLHFQQVFKTLEIAGYPWAGRCQHLSYEVVNLPGNVVMASREGTVVLLEDLIREATQRALQGGGGEEPRRWMKARNRRLPAQSDWAH